MPDPKPISPPLRKPVSELTRPSHRVGYYTELVNRDDSAYLKTAPIKRGTLYSSMRMADPSVVAMYPQGLYFLKEIKPGNSADYGNTDQYVIWVWTTERPAQSSTNADITYGFESVSAPAFARVYEIRRDVYQTTPTLTIGLPLTALIAVTITAGGTGYTTASGTVATGATVEFVCIGGAIVSGIVTNEGVSITSGASIVITGDGTGATATAVIQPANAILVSQKKMEFPEDNVLSHEFVQVLRVYEVIPGPVLTGTEYDDYTGGILTVTRQKVNAGTSSAALSGSTYTIIQPIDTITAWKITRVVTTLSTTSYHVRRRVSLPRVLTALTDIIFNDTDGNIIWQGYHATLKDYSGVYDVTVTEAFSGNQTPFTGLSATDWRPEAFDWNTPFTEGSVPECLHSTITIAGNTASDGSTPGPGGTFYAYTQWSFVFTATSPSSLSGTVTITDTQRRFLGGWLRTTETISVS